MELALSGLLRLVLCREVVTAAGWSFEMQIDTLCLCWGRFLASWLVVGPRLGLDLVYYLDCFNQKFARIWGEFGARLGIATRSCWNIDPICLWFHKGTLHRTCDYFSGKSHHRWFEIDRTKGNATLIASIFGTRNTDSNCNVQHRAVIGRTSWSLELTQKLQIHSRTIRMYIACIKKHQNNDYYHHNTVPSSHPRRDPLKGGTLKLSCGIGIDSNLSALVAGFTMRTEPQSGTTSVRIGIFHG